MNKLFHILTTLIACTSVIVSFSSCADDLAAVSTEIVESDSADTVETTDSTPSANSELEIDKSSQDGQNSSDTDPLMATEADTLKSDKANAEPTEEDGSEPAEQTDSDKNGNSQDSEQTNMEHETIYNVSDASLFDYLSPQDMDGYNFRILTRPEYLSDQYSKEQNGDVINDAVYRRNEIIKALFNVDITVTKSYTDTTSEAINQILAGNDKYDIIFPDAKTAFDYAVRGACVDFNTVSSIDKTKEWWAKDIVDSCNVNGHLYVLDGGISVSSLSSARCMLFNKHIFDEIGYEYPYRLVSDGNWTFDEFSKLAKQGVMDLNGDDKITAEADTLGFYTYNNTAPVSALYAGAQRVYTNNPDGIPTLSVNSAKTVDIFTKLFTFTGSEEASMHSGKWDKNSDIFTQGRAMFTDIYTLGNVTGMRNMTDEFGILPWPKFYAEDNHMTPFNKNASLMIMPVTVTDSERSGKLAEALCAVGYKDVMPAFYDITLKTKFAYDSESEAMIDIIKDSLVYDIGYLTNSEFGLVGPDLADMDNPDFYSYYAKGENNAVSELDEFIKAYGNVG